MNSRVFRNWLVFLPVYLGIEYAVIFAGCYLYDRDDAAWPAIIGLGLLYLFRMASGLLNLLVSVPMHFITKSQRINEIVSRLYAVKFPLTEETRFMEASDLLNVVAADDHAPKDARLFSALTLGELSAFRVLGKPILTMQALFAIDAALARYRGEYDAASAGI